MARVAQVDTASPGRQAPEPPMTPVGERATRLPVERAEVVRVGTEARGLAAAVPTEALVWLVVLQGPAVVDLNWSVVEEVHEPRATSSVVVLLRCRCASRRLWWLAARGRGREGSHRGNGRTRATS